MTRTINVSGDEVEYLTARVTERAGQSLVGVTWEVALSDTGEPPIFWNDANGVQLDPPSVAHVSLLVNDDTPLGADQRLWVRATDTPEVIILGLTASHQRIDVI